MKIKRLSILVVLLLTAVLLSACGEPAGPKPPGKYADVAKCLTQKGVIMYGAYWCPHCAAQKKIFGDDFQFITYQECDDAGTNGNHKLCLEKGVTSYPTWIFPGQGNLVGEQQPASLAQLANCQDKLPQEDQDKLKQAEDAAAKAKASPAATTPTPAVAPAPASKPATTVTSTATPIIPSAPATTPPATK
jgi:glutaredoxin